MILEFYALKITQPDSGGSYVGGAEDTESQAPRSGQVFRVMCPHTDEMERFWC